MSVFENNLALYTRMNPEDQEKLRACKPSSVEESRESASKWLIDEQIEKRQNVIHYGIGEGFAFEVAKPWLEQSKEHFLFFFEHDLLAIRAFLETERAFDLLSHPQVFAFSFERQEKMSWSQFFKKMDKIVWAIREEFVHYSALPSYQGPFFETLKSQFFTRIENIRFNCSNYYPTYMYTLFNNLYHNVFQWPKARFGHLAKNQFEQVPAIICGAGPSLKKDLPLLKELGENRALIFAAGSALNVVGRYGIRPHFGGGVDPTETQLSRISTNAAFNVPFFYYNRFNHGALEELSHEKLFIKGAVFPPACTWFEEEAGIIHPDKIDTEVSTSNFCLHMAHYLGCSPIIFLGMDLAYTDEARYPEGGIAVHPLDKKSMEDQLTDISKRLLQMESEDGKPVKTKSDWVFERDSYNMFAARYPDTIFINATQKGLPIKNFTSMPFQEVIDTHLSKEQPLSLLVHQMAQNCSFPTKVTKEKVTEIMDQWFESVCQVEEGLEAIELICPEDSTPETLWQKSIVSDDKWKEEPFFYAFLKKLRRMYYLFVEKRIMPFRYHPDQFSLEAHIRCRENLETFIYKHLLATAKNHHQLILRIIEEQTPSEPVDGKTPVVDLDQEVPFPPNRKACTHYPSGKIKSEVHYLDDALHGSATFFAENGKIFGKGWFIEGKQEGRSYAFYDTGALFSVQEFLRGMQDGKEETYYKNGALKSCVPYKEGKLHGTVSLYYPNGQKKREVPFKEGVLEGIEQSFFSSGQKRSYVEYSENQPINKSIYWYSSGQLAKELTFYKGREDYDELNWDKKGRLTKKGTHLPEDSLKRFKARAKDFDNQLGNLTDLLEGLQ